MKKSLYIFFIFISFFTYAQKGPNPFAEKETETAFNKDVPVKENDKDLTQKDSGGGNPGGVVPIDDYIPFLIIAALGLIIYQARREKEVQ